MFERFTDRARRVVVLAQEEARMLDHSYIGTEHVLLGLIHESEGVAAKSLEALGIRLDAVRQEVEQVIGRGKKMPEGHIPFTPRAKKVLELSLREALQLNHNYIGTEHILLGLVREGEGVAAQVLVKLGASLNVVRQEVIKQLHENPDVEHRRAFAGRSWERGEVLKMLTRINERLTAIERHLGLPAPRDAAVGEDKPAGGADAPEGSAAGAAEDEPGEPSSGTAEADPGKPSAATGEGEQGEPPAGTGEQEASG
jgi:ATP-dependent Clp protease ATP-binding subunit ClpA